MVEFRAPRRKRLSKAYGSNATKGACVTGAQNKAKILRTFLGCRYRRGAAVCFCLKGSETPMGRRILSRVRAYPPTRLHAPAKFAPPPNFRDPIWSFLLTGAPPPHPPSLPRPSGANGPFGGDSEAISNGRPFRMEGYFD